MSHPSITLSTGHTVEYLNEDDNDRIHKLFPTYGDMIKLQPGGWFFEECMARILERIHNFQLQSTDILVMTFPKSGTNWSSEIIWTFLHNPNLNNPDAKIPSDYRSTQICSDFFLKLKHAPKLATAADLLRNAIQKVNPERVDDEFLIFTYTELCLKHPRVIKTNLSLSLWPSTTLEKSKIIYVARNLRDVIISRYSWFKLMKTHNYLGTFDEYIDYFLNEELFYNPYWQHLKEAWDQRHHPNLLFLLYEDMLTEPFREYNKINKFLGLNLTETQVKNIVDYCNFENMKKRNESHEPMSDEGNLTNEQVKQNSGGYFRKGKSGDWKDKFSPEQVEKINNWIQKSTKDFPRDVPYLVIE